MRRSLVALALVGCAHSFDQPASLPLDRARATVDRTRTWPDSAPDEAFRNTQPSPVALPTQPPPAIEEGHLANGVRVLLVERHDLPLVRFGIAVSRGAIDAPPGQFAVILSAMSRGSRSTPVRDYWTYLDAFGVRWETQSSREYGYFAMWTLPPFARGPARLLGEAATQPEFDQETFDRIKKQSLDGLADPESPRSVAADLTFPPGHPYGRTRAESLTGIGALTQRDAATRHYGLVAKDSVTVIASGDIEMARVISFFDKTVGAMTTSASPRVVVSAASIPPRKLVVLDRPTARQDNIVVSFLGVPFDHPDFPALSVLATVLARAGWTHSRLEQGSTYGVSASLQRLRGPAALELSWSTDPDGTLRSLQDMLKTFEQLRGAPIEQARIEVIKQAKSRIVIEAGDSTAESLATLAEIAGLDLSIDAWNKLIARFGTVTAEDVQRVANKYLDLDHMVLVVAGEAARLKAECATLGLGAVETR